MSVSSNNEKTKIVSHQEEGESNGNGKIFFYKNKTAEMTKSSNNL